MFLEKLLTLKAGVAIVFLSTQLSSWSGGNFSWAENFLPDKLIVVNQANLMVVLASPEKTDNFKVSHLGLLPGCLPWLSLGSKRSINEVSLPL